MLVTKNSAELCTLLVNEIYGQLPSRIIAALLSRGRSNVRDLAQHTSLNPKQVRHGLALVIQHSLVFYQTDHETSITTYEANPRAAYHLVRIGKVLDTIETKYGSMAKNIVNDLMMLGQVEIGQLVRYHISKHTRETVAINGKQEHDRDYDDENDLENEDLDETFSHDGDDAHLANGADVDHDAADDAKPIEAEEVYGTLAQLIAAGVLESVVPSMFESPQDLRASVEQECTKEFPNGIRGAKVISEFDMMVKSQIKTIGAERATLKRKLQESALYEPSNIKRRKLANGAMSSGFAGDSGASILQEECLVDLRNRKLIDHAEDFVGETTAQVFSALLSALCRKVYRCQHDLHTIITEEEEEAFFSGVRATTEEVLDHLGPGVDVFTGIGAAAETDIDVRFAERIRKYPPQIQGSHVQGLDEGDEVMGSDDEEYDQSGERPRGAHINGKSRGSAAQDGEELSSQTSRAEQLYQLRQHLLILCEAKQQFVRHCGQNQWTVDFAPLVQQLKYAELDTIIEDSFGRQGLRLTRILREKGKLDEKTLPAMALMRKPDVHVKMAEMEMAGFLEVQEVPRDNNRAANRTMFFWFFDEPRTLKRVLDNTYKSMVRCMERLEVERAKKKNILHYAYRRDVQGKEEELLRGDVYNEYLEFVETEKKLLSQVSRLDDLVSILQDF